MIRRWTAGKRTATVLVVSFLNELLSLGEDLLFRDASSTSQTDTGCDRRSSTLTSRFLATLLKVVVGLVRWIEMVCQWNSDGDRAFDFALLRPFELDQVRRG